jgi:HAMP domain-containing protein
MNWPKRLKALAWNLLLVSFFSILPILLIDTALQYLAKLSEDTLREASWEKLERVNEKLFPLSQPEFFIKGFLRQRIAQADAAQDPQAEIVRLLDQAKQKKPDLWDFFIFDEKGSLIRLLGKRQIGKRVPEKVLGILSEFFQGRGERLTDLKPWYQAFFGSSRRELPFKEGSGWLNTSSKDKNTWVFYHVGNHFSILANLHKRGFEPTSAIQGFINRRKGNHAPQIQLYNLVTGHSLMRSETRLDEKLHGIIERFQQEPTTRFRAFDRVWSLLHLDNRHLLIASMPDEAETHSRNTLIKYRQFSLLFTALLISTVLLFSLFQIRVNLSLRWKLMGLFLFSVGIPLVILGFIGKVYLDERLKSLLNQENQIALERLRHVDGNSGSILWRAEKAFSNIATNINMKSPEHLERFKENLRNLTKKFLIISRLYSGDGEEIPIYEWKLSEDAAEKLLKDVFIAIFYELSDNKDSPKFAEHAKSMAVLESFLGDNLEFFIDSALGQIGRFFPQELGEKSSYQLIKVLRDQNQKMTHILCASWDKVEMLKTYLRVMLPKRNLADGTRFLAVFDGPFWKPSKQEPNQRHPGFPFKKVFWSVPPFPESPELMQFLKKLRKTGRFASMRMSIGSEDFNVCGLYGKELSGFALLSLKPLPKMFREIESLSWKLMFFHGFAVLVALFLALLFSRSFLEPIKELGKGVDAVGKEDFRYRIPWDSGDELGQLIEHFNRVMENLQEVSSAKVVQENLFPEGLLQVGEYQVTGMNRPATDLGGDYFDFLAVNDSLFVLVGDVTGHGIPAALVMAMTKALVSSFASMGSPPEKILESLNQLLYHSFRMRPRLSITICILQIDLTSHQVKILSCGHPYPLFQDAKGKLEFIKTGGSPAGVTKKIRCQVETRTLCPGDSVILYSDGMVESLPDLPHQQDKFLQFQEFLAGLSAKGPVETCKAVFAQHPFLQLNLPQPDDFTVVVVSRMNEKSAPPSS